MPDNSLQNGTDNIATDELTTVNGAAAPAGLKVQRSKVGFGPDGALRDVDQANPLPVTFPAGRSNVTIADTQADVHGQLVGVTRISQISTKFFQQGPAASLNISLSGGATATGPTLGGAVFASGTAVTSALLAQTPTGILYAAQYEAWAVLSGAYTAPTSAATFQRLGIYEATNGYSFGYNGLTFGLWVRVNSVDTFIPQANWNRDILNGAATSLFTSNGAPVVFVPTNMNMFRKRFGWYGAVSAFYEVYAPDGNWVVVHQVRTANSQTGVNITMPDLPMTVEISKNAADATNLTITCGGWAAGITAPNSGPNLSGQRSLAALNAALIIPLAGISELSFAIAGTWAGTLSFQSSLDGLAWIADAAMNSVSKVFSTSTTVNGTFTAAISSDRFYRVLASVWTSGSASIVYSGSPSSNLVIAQLLLTDGANNGPVAVKPASTAAVATDASLVVALHPSSPTPAGTNIVGALVANQSVNKAQIAGVAIAAGAGVVTLGTQRMVQASDVIQPAISESRAATLHVSATGAVNTAVTATLPAPAAGLFHYITSVQLVKVYNALGVAAGAGVVVTSTNLPGGPAWTTEQAAGAVGTAVTVINYQPTTPLKVAAAAVATSFTAPLQGQTIWRWNISYFTAP